MGDSPDTGDAAGGIAPIEVDVDNLAEFRSLLGRELSANLQPGSDRICGDHNMGVRFGQRNIGGRVRAARDAYGNTLVASTGNLWQYIRTSEILIEVIQRVVAGYASADQSAAGTAQKLKDALNGVWTERSDAAEPYARSETRRELHRMQAGVTTPPNVS